MQQTAASTRPDTQHAMVPVQLPVAEEVRLVKATTTTSICVAAPTADSS